MGRDLLGSFARGCEAPHHSADLRPASTIVMVGLFNRPPAGERPAIDDP